MTEEKQHEERIRRELLAGIALLGMLAGGQGHELGPAALSTAAYALADAMVAAGGPL